MSTEIFHIIENNISQEMDTKKMANETDGACSDVSLNVTVVGQGETCCPSVSLVGSESMDDESIPLFSGIDVTYFYDKEGVIGSGRSAKVYKVRHRVHKTLAAAKEITYRSIEVKEKIINEIDILKKLSGSDYVVQLKEVIDCCRTKPKRMILITEYLEGGELFYQITNEDLLTESHVVKIMKQILEAVTFIHEKGILHRDLKPENIIYQSQSIDKIKIIDFGFAVEFNPKKPPKSMVGTTLFVAPEVLRFENQSFQTDIWSVGIIAFNLLSGITPFEIPQSGDPDRQLTEKEIVKNIERCKYNYEDDGFVGVSDEAKDFISKILIRDSRKRMTGAQCLKHPWLVNSLAIDTVCVNRTVSMERMRSYVATKMWGKAFAAIRSMNVFMTAISDGVHQPHRPAEKG